MIKKAKSLSFHVTLKSTSYEFIPARISRTHLKHARPQFDEPKLLISQTKMAKIMARITVTAKLFDFTYAILFRTISHSISLTIEFDNFFLFCYSQSVA